MADYADPTIALRVNPGLIYGAGGGNQLNPLDAIKTFADVQRTNLMNQQLQLELGAKQTAGEVLSMSPDLQTGLETLRRSNVAPYIPQVLEGLAATDKTMVDASRARQVMSDSALDNTIKMSVMQPDGFDENIWNATKAMGLANIDDPRARARANVAMETFRQAWTANTTNPDGTPNNAMINYKKTLALMPYMNPEMYQYLIGQRMVQPSMVPSGPPTAGPLPPGTIGYRPAGAGPAPGAGAGAGAGAGGDFGAGAPSITAGDGKPLIPDANSPSMQLFPPKTVPTTPSGAFIQDEAMGIRAKELQSKFSEDDRRFDNASSALGNLSFMENALDTMVKAGGFTAPGRGADARVEFAARANMVAQWLGVPNPFDTKAVGVGEDFARQTIQMGIQTLTTLLGNQREAEGVIHRMTAAQPGIENTPLGAKMLIEAIRAQVNRSIEMHDFENMWLNQHGNLINAKENFNYAHGAEGYTEGALNRLNMGANMSPQDIVNAQTTGYLPEDVARAMVKNNFQRDPNTGQYIRIPRTPTGAPGQPTQ